MGILQDDLVIISQSEKEGDTSVITVNCPDKTGLGCDLCRIILFFGLSIVRGDFSTDGKWCFVVFWVVGKEDTRWLLLKKRLVEACPSCSSASWLSFYSYENQPPRPPNVFLLKLCCYDRRGLLHDVTRVLSELELIIKKVKVSTTPDGKVMDMFFVTDTREVLHTWKRKDETINHLRVVIGEAMLSCEIEIAGGPEVTACSQAAPFLPSAITGDVLQSEMPVKLVGGLVTSENVSIKMDNQLSRAHTLVQISCQEHKGLLYDIMRTLKDSNIQISYGRFSVTQRRICELELFLMKADGKKIADLSEQQALASLLESELSRPLRVAVVSRGPDTELLVANPVELSGKGRPLVFHDITLALKMLDSCIFSAEVGRHMIGDREWEVYRVLLNDGEGEGLSVPRDKVKEQAWKLLMGWD